MKAVVFPGQGSQYVGMAKELYDEFPECRSIIKKADDMLGYQISEIMFEGSADELQQTNHAQPAIFLHSYLIFKMILVEDVKFVAGHSLGEYTALCFSKAMDFEDTFRIVARRGEIMNDVSIEKPGAMVAVLGASSDQVSKILENSSKHGNIQVANYNAPGQIILSGEVSAVDQAVLIGKSCGAKLVQKLNVSGAFHSQLMKQGEVLLERELEKIEIKDADIPILQNVTAEIETKASMIRKKLVEQLASPVQWEKTIRKLSSLGVTEYFELGPGKVLQKLIRRIDPSAKTVTVGTKEEVQPYLL